VVEIRAARQDRPFAQTDEWQGSVLRGSACLATFANRSVGQGDRS
jgi:hypothetical protein